MSLFHLLFNNHFSSFIQSLSNLFIVFSLSHLCMSTSFLYNGISVLNLHSWGIFTVLKMTQNNLANLFSPSPEPFHIYANVRVRPNAFPFLIFLNASFPTSFSYRMPKPEILLNAPTHLLDPSSPKHFPSAAFPFLIFLCYCLIFQKCL